MAGRYVGAKMPQEKASDLALDATLRAAAPHQSRRRAAESQTASPATADHQQKEFLIEPWDLREKARETKTGNLILFVVDASDLTGTIVPVARRLEKVVRNHGGAEIHGAEGYVVGVSTPVRRYGRPH